MVYQVSNYYGNQSYPQVQQDYAGAKKYAAKAESVNNNVFGYAAPVSKPLPASNSNPAKISDSIDSDEKILLALEALPPVRRIASVPDKLDNGDIIPALGLGALAVVNLPEDCRDIKAGYDAFSSWIRTGKFRGGYDYKDFQHDFSFFRGTLLEPLVDLKNAKNQKLAKKLLKWDKPIVKTSFGIKFLNFLNVKEGKTETIKKFNKETGVWETAKDINGFKRYVTSFEGNAFGKLTARAMTRTTLIGTVILAALELPKIFKAMGQGQTIGEQATNTAKQTVKSGINFASVTAGIAYGGALGSKYCHGPFGSLIGMGAGAVLGGLVSKKAQEMLN